MQVQVQIWRRCRGGAQSIRRRRVCAEVQQESTVFVQVFVQVQSRYKGAEVHMCILAANVADMSPTCDTVAHVTVTQNQLTVPTPYVGISMYEGRYTLSDDIFAKCVDQST